MNDRLIPMPLGFNRRAFSHDCPETCLFFLHLLGLTIVLSENITLSYGTPEH